MGTPDGMTQLPTTAELRILDVLWNGPATVRGVHEALGEDVAYTTTLKLLQIMHEKGLVARDEAGRAHVYRALVRREATEAGLVRDLARRVFGGSSARLALRALAEESATEAELAELSALLDRLERDRDP